MNNYCTCDTTVTFDQDERESSTVAELCDFCREMLWAAELEAGFERTVDDGVEAAFDARDFTIHNLVMEKREIEKLVEDEIGTALDDFDFDNVIERFLDDKDYIEKDELAASVEDAVGELEIVQQVAAGAAEAAMKTLDKFAKTSEVERLERDLIEQRRRNLEQMTAVYTALVPRELSFGQRLRWLLTGKF